MFFCSVVLPFTISITVCVTMEFGEGLSFVVIDSLDFSIAKEGNL